MPQPISTHELAAKLAAGEPVYLLDVRLPAEHGVAALADAVLIPLHELPRRWQEVRPPPDAAIVAYCHLGVRSWAAAAWLEAAGFDNVLSLTGGIDAWACDIEPTMARY